VVKTNGTACGLVVLVVHVFVVVVVVVVVVVTVVVVGLFVAAMVRLMCGK